MTAKKTTSARKKAETKEKTDWGGALAPRRNGERRYWLVKSEPDVFSFDDLLNEPRKTTHWDGVRNNTARIFLRDGMKKGDLVFFYHSMTNPPAVVGICEVTREGYPDHTAFDPGSGYYDPASSPASPKWFMVDLKAVRKLAKPVSLASIREKPALAGMALVRISRLSVSPVTETEWKTIVRMSE